MPSFPIEVILTKQLASYLAMPTMILDPQGTLIYFNEAAEAVLGVRYDETGPLAMEQWSGMVERTDEDGQVLSPDEGPLRVALRGIPSHRKMEVLGPDRTPREIEVTAFPLVGVTGGMLGVVGIFWESR